MGNDLLKKTILNKKYKAICLNDAAVDEEFESAKNYTNKLFETKFPVKSDYEKDEDADN